MSDVANQSLHSINEIVELKNKNASLEKTVEEQNKKINEQTATINDQARRLDIAKTYFDAKIKAHDSCSIS